jgi:hypothetical protein
VSCICFRISVQSINIAFDRARCMQYNKHPACALQYNNVPLYTFYKMYNRDKEQCVDVPNHHCACESLVSISPLSANDEDVAVLLLDDGAVEVDRCGVFAAFLGDTIRGGCG